MERHEPQQSGGVAEVRSGNRSGVEVSWKKRNGIAGRNLSTRKPQRSLVEAESSGASTNDARTRKDVGINRRTQGGLYGRHPPPAGRVNKDERDL